MVDEPYIACTPTPRISTEFILYEVCPRHTRSYVSEANNKQLLTCKPIPIGSSDDNVGNTKMF
jgi:hypothetical protein